MCGFRPGNIRRATSMACWPDRYRNRPDLWANPLQPNKLKDLRILNRILDLKRSSRNCTRIRRTGPNGRRLIVNATATIAVTQKQRRLSTWLERLKQVADFAWQLDPYRPYLSAV